MLKKRLIACLVIKNKIVVQSIGFKKYLPVGSVEVSVEALNRWGIDEIIILDIDATNQKRGPNFELAIKASKKSFVPLTIGGGVKSIDDMRKLVHYGADKISINNAAVDNPEIIKKAAEIFGNQCVIVSIDAKKREGNRYEVFLKSGNIPTGIDPTEWAGEAEKLGAGEILLNSIDRDGSKKGYDIELIKAVSEVVKIPVIACGGAGHPEHFLEALNKGGVSAVAAANYFHFTEHSPITTKAYLAKQIEDIRLDTYANYNDFSFNEDGRINKHPESYLDALKFSYFADEVI